MKTFYRKIALVTGGSSGIGLAIARLLAQQGAHVWVLARNAEKLATALESIKEARLDTEQRFGMVVADVSSVAQVNAAVEQVTNEIGLPDLIFNCAGVTQPGYFQEQDLEIFHRVMDIDYFGMVYVTKAVIPGMIARGSGHVVNVSSVTGYLGFFGYTAYGAAKFAVTGFSEILRAEMKFHGVRVSLVCPPDVDTPQLAYEEPYKPLETRAVSSLGKVMTPEAVAKEILRGVKRDQFLILPGSDAKMVYILSRILGGNVYSVMDIVIRLSSKIWKSKNKEKSKETGHNGHL